MQKIEQNYWLLVFIMLYLIIRKRKILIESKEEMKMLKEEFEKLVGFSIDDECYKRIEECYMECEFFFSKEQCADFYKRLDMNGFENLYKDVLAKRKLKERIKNLCLIG